MHPAQANSILNRSQQILLQTREVLRVGPFRPDSHVPGGSRRWRDAWQPWLARSRPPTFSCRPWRGTCVSTFGHTAARGSAPEQPHLGRSRSRWQGLLLGTPRGNAASTRYEERQGEKVPGGCPGSKLDSGGLQGSPQNSLLSPVGVPPISGEGRAGCESDHGGWSDLKGRRESPHTLAACLGPGLPVFRALTKAFWGVFQDVGQGPKGTCTFPQEGAPARKSPVSGHLAPNPN